MPPHQDWMPRSPPPVNAAFGRHRALVKGLVGWVAEGDADRRLSIAPRGATLLAKGQATGFFAMADRYYTGTFEFTSKGRGILSRTSVTTKTMLFEDVHPSLYDSLDYVRTSDEFRMIHHAELSREEGKAMAAAFKASGRDRDVLDLAKILDIVESHPDFNLLGDDDRDAIEA